jgi:hypothetical protein
MGKGNNRQKNDKKNMKTKAGHKIQDQEVISGAQGAGPG